MIIVITGTPGTGKTTIARMLGEKLGLPVYSVGDFVKGEEVDVKELEEKANVEEGILEGHLFSETKIRADWVFVLRTRPSVLLKRLLKRYPFEKAWKNVVAEAIDYCKIMALDHYGDACEVDTTERGPDETVEKILRIMDGKDVCDSVDWTEDFKALLYKHGGNI